MPKKFKKKIKSKRKPKKQEGKKEVIIKIKSEWVKNSLINKPEYEKKYKKK